MEWNKVVAALVHVDSVDAVEVVAAAVAGEVEAVHAAGVAAGADDVVVADHEAGAAAGGEPHLVV